MSVKCLFRQKIQRISAGDQTNFCHSGNFCTDHGCGSLFVISVVFVYSACECDRNSVQHSDRCGRVCRGSFIVKRIDRGRNSEIPEGSCTGETCQKTASAALGG